MKYIFVLILAAYSSTTFAHNVELQINDKKYSFECPSNQSIFDAASQAGIVFEFPYDCGTTGLSRSIVNYGLVDNTKQSYLSKSELENNFCLLSVAYPNSDCSLTLLSIKGQKQNSIKLKSGNILFTQNLGGNEQCSYIDHLTTVRVEFIGVGMSTTPYFTLLRADISSPIVDPTTRAYYISFIEEQHDLYINCLQDPEYGNNWHIDFRMQNEGTVGITLKGDGH